MDDEARAFMVAVASGVSQSFIWPGSGGGSASAAGVSQLGNARMAVASNSAITGGYNNGFLLLNQNHESLHHIGSAWTAMLGHSKMVDHTRSQDFGGASATTTRWITQSGSFLLSSANAFGSVQVSFPTAHDFIAPPFVHLSVLFDFVNSGPVSTYALNVSSITTGGFSAVYSALSGAKIDTTVLWESNGTATL